MDPSPSVANAEALRKKHEAEEAHHVTVEDAIDEDDGGDVQHPPMANGDNAHSTGASIPTNPAGKQSATAGSPERPNEKLDTTSHEAFPRLGGGAAARPVGTAWGTQKSPPVSTRADPLPAPTAVNGDRRHGSAAAAASQPSSRRSTPASSGLTAPIANTPAAHHQRVLAPQTVSIPGQHSERISLLPREMKPRSQLKKPVQDVLRDINRKSKANVQMSSGAAGSVHFDARGPVDAVRQALKEVAKELGSKQSIKVTVPASVRPYIIGRQGAVIQAISQRTGARIQLPKPDEATVALGGVDDDDDDDDADDAATIDVLIEGDSVAAVLARREVEQIVDERTSSVHVKLRDIPAELYLFLTGPHNVHVPELEGGKDVRLHVPPYHAWVNRPVPPPPSSSSSGPGLFHLPPAAPAHPITISGDRQATEATRAKVQRRVQELTRRLACSSLEIERARHKFILGDRGTSAHDFLAETGCVVVIPPATHETETLTIIGPPDKLEDGINKASDLATSMQMMNVDISKQHSDAPGGPSAHARRLTRYLQQRREVDRLERLYDAHIALPTAEHGPITWGIYSRQGRNMIRARTEIINIVNGHPPARLSPIEVEPFYHPHLRERASRMVQSDYGVRLVFPDDDDETSREILLVYEGFMEPNAPYDLPTKPPTTEEVRRFRQAFSQAEEHLLRIVGAPREIVTKNIAIPPTLNEKLRKFVAQEQQSLPPGELPVQVRVGGIRHAGLATNPIAAASLTNEAILRGPADGVRALADSIASFIDQEARNERERDFTLTFAFPPQFSSHLIGKKGENVRKYREEFDVEIRVQDGTVEIKGPPAKAETARSRILALGKRLQDEATYVLKIDPRYHRDLIGLRGGQVHRLQDRYHVRIHFPRPASSSHAKDDQSATDSVSDVGGPHSTARSHPDEVVVKGPKKGADEARDELLSLLQWTKDHSHTAIVSVAQNQVPMLIGHGGREMDKIRVATGAQVDIPDVKREASDPLSGGRVSISLKGTKTQVEEAKQLLEQRARVFDDNITKTMEVDRKHHRALIGVGGANLREIVTRAGGPDDRRELARMVRFPSLDSNENTIRIEGNVAVVEKIIAAIENQVIQRQNETVETLTVPAEKHRFLIGRGGETRRRLEAQFDVKLDIPRPNATGPGGETVKVTGRRDDVNRARDHILNLIKSRGDETVQVPRRLHHAIANHGQFFRQLRHDFGVSVEHAGHQPPARPDISNHRSEAQGGQLPLITDDSTPADVFSWHVRNNDDDAAGDGDVPWVLRGPADGVGQARQKLEAAIVEARKPISTGYLILPDPRTYRLVIGPSGSQVNSIRQSTGCKIDVPRNQNKGEAIEIQGEREKVEEAKNIIVGLVQGGETGPHGGRPRRG